jgi:hypothetical protein
MGTVIQTRGRHQRTARIISERGFDTASPPAWGLTARAASTAATADERTAALSRYAAYGIFGGCLLGAVLMMIATLVTPVAGARIAAPLLILLGALLGGAVGGPYGMLFIFARPERGTAEADWVRRQHGAGESSGFEYQKETVTCNSE